jgi:serine/threonine protein kinase
MRRSEGNASRILGQTISHCRILQKLGGGGMGVVYEAEDAALGRRVALKFLPPELSSDPAALGRVQREVRAASALNHPNICTIHEIGKQDGQCFIVMKLLEGKTLRDHILDRSLPTDELLTLSRWRLQKAWMRRIGKGSFIATSSRRTSS